MTPNVARLDATNMVCPARGCVGPKPRARYSAYHRDRLIDIVRIISTGCGITDFESLIAAAPKRKKESRPKLARTLSYRFPALGET